MQCTNVYLRCPPEPNELHIRDLIAVAVRDFSDSGNAPSALRGIRFDDHIVADFVLDVIARKRAVLFVWLDLCADVVASDLFTKFEKDGRVVDVLAVAVKSEVLAAAVEAIAEFRIDALVVE